MAADDRAIDQRRAKVQLSGVLCDLAANMIRVTRGAGKPQEIMSQAAALVRAFVAYHEAFGHHPMADDLANMLSVEADPETLGRMRAENADRADAEQRIIYGALQIVASRLLDQRTKETNGRREFYDGVRMLEQVRADKRDAPPRYPGRA